MIKGLLTKKMIVLYLSMAIIGFLIGYDYALITVRNNKRDVINVIRRIEDNGREHKNGRDYEDGLRESTFYER